MNSLISPDIMQQITHEVIKELAKHNDMMYTIVVIGLILSIVIIWILTKILISNKLDLLLEKQLPDTDDFAIKISNKLKYPEISELSTSVSTIFSTQLESMKREIEDLSAQFSKNINDYPNGIRAILGKLDTTLNALTTLTTKVNTDTEFIKEEIIKIGYLLKIFKSSISNDDLN